MTTIKSITAKGFKSFAKNTEIIFCDKYSSIIGPNGSGKSNVCDAITFVLGKISAKSMRAERASHLIYNGGKNNPPSKEAVASIIFDNSKKEFPLTEKAVKITRIVRQTGNSIYRVNDKTVTRQQVLDLLAMAKIDPDGHNIILQGDIVRFTEMKPEARREVIEEVSGISIYNDKKLKAMNELDKVEEKLKEAEIILTERKSHLRELKNERDQALKYKELEKKIKDNKATFLNLQTKDKENSRAEIEGKIKEHQLDINKVQLKIDELKKIINDKKEDIKKINQEIELRGEKEQLKLHKEVEELKTDLLKSTTRVDTCKNEIDKNKKRKEQLRKDSSDLQTQITELKKKLEVLTKNKKLILDKESKIIKDIDEFKSKHDIKDEGDIDGKIESISNDISKLQEEKQEIIREYDKLSFKLDDLDKKLNADKEEGSKFDLSGLRKDFKDVTLRLSKCLNNDSVYAAKLGNLRSNLVNLNEELAKLNVQSISVKARSFDNLAIEKILKSEIKGIYNTVSELGRVNKNYSLALEVAAGSRLKSIVVEDDLVGAKCIKYLKDNKLGVITFLPLNKIKGVYITNLIRSNGIHGLAVELVKFDPKFRNIFSYVFGNTVVVDNLSVARGIGIGKTRMVTMEGDLVELSGAMIGGYRKSRGTAFKEVDFDDKINKLENKVNELRKEVTDLEEKREENEELISDLREKKANLEAEIIKFEKTYGLFDISKLKEERKDITTKLRDFKYRLNNIARDMLNSNNELSSLKLKRNNLFGNRTLNEFSNKQQKSREELITIESEIKNFNTQLGFIENEKSKILSIIKNHDKEIEEFSGEIEELNNKIIKNKNILKEKEKEEKLFYNEFKDLFTKRNKFNEFIQNKETSLIREEERIRGFQDKINNVNLIRAKVIAELEGLQREFEPFKDAKIRKGVNLDEIKFEIQDAEKNLNRMGNVNLRALEVYEELEKDYSKLIGKADKLKIEKDDVLNLMNEIEGRKNDLFVKTFKVLNDNFKHIFLNLSTKGDAFLELENKENPLDGGVDVKVRLTGNKFLDIKSLSGGEKTLTALAFIFAIQEFQPASFYLLDEVDAALDKTNSEKLSRLIAQYSKHAQYIVISHNDAVISEADQIYGVSMQQGISKVVSLKI
ncbi:MAG: chromosome segregation protein SMC [Nanoarchaeota archaeon]|nr:chromosome segregation protein SMC [Nanoarchaeota archaeon]